MKPIGEVYGIDLSALNGAPLGQRPTPECPGARLRITRVDFNAMVEAGECFRDEAKLKREMPREGYADARTYCTNFVEVGPKGCAGEPVVYGLCATCQRAEDYNRTMLRERQLSQEKQR